MKNTRHGFTLVELLVVIVIITILAASLAILIKGLIAKSKNNKTVAFIQTLNMGCQSYKIDFQTYPPMDYPSQGAQSLHVHLGSPRLLQLQKNSSGPAITETKGPIMEFRRDMVENEPNVTTPPPALRLRDGWQQLLWYQFPGTNNPKSVDIWAWCADQTGGDSTLWVTNWQKDF